MRNALNDYTNNSLLSLDKDHVTFCLENLLSWKMNGELSVGAVLHVYIMNTIDTVKGIIWDFFIFTLEQIIVLNKNCT